MEEQDKLDEFDISSIKQAVTYFDEKESNNIVSSEDIKVVKNEEEISLDDIVAKPPCNNEEDKVVENRKKVPLKDRIARLTNINDDNEDASKKCMSTIINNLSKVESLIEEYTESKPKRIKRVKNEDESILIKNTLADIYDNPRNLLELGENEEGIHIVNSKEQDTSRKIDTIDGLLIGKGLVDEDGEILMDKYYLSNFIDKVPHGIFDKRITGVGVTTIEILSKRHSIIVMPTKSLAYSKHLQHPTTLYIGSDIDNVNDKMTNSFSQVESYVNNEAIEFKKFLVVADSLWLLIEKLESLGVYSNVFEEFFFMVDEIDLMQEDNSYRPNLESVMDYYFEFNKKNRCLVSATIKEFSHPLLQDECTISIDKLNIQKQRRNPLIIETNNIVQQLVPMLKAENDNKILIALNSIDYIKAIINLLPEELKNECSILCGDSSTKKVGKLRKSLDNNKLPSKITFMTSTYFAGIDIDDSYDLITVINQRSYYQLLSIEKIVQIYGRCRGENIIYRDTIIYQPKLPPKLKKGVKKQPKKIYIPKQRYRKYLVNNAQKVLELFKACDLISNNQKNLTKLFDKIRVGIRESATESLGYGANMELTREDVFGENVISYFNIDSLVEKNELFYKTYKNKENILKALAQYEIVPKDYVYSIFDDDVESDDSLKEVNDEARKAALEELEKAINHIQESNKDNSLSDDYFEQLLKGRSGIVKRFVDRLYSVYKYADVNELIPILLNINHKDDRAFRPIHNAIIYWALEDNHPYKLSIKNEFSIGSKYTPEEIEEKINNINTYHVNNNSKVPH